MVMLFILFMLVALQEKPQPPAFQEKPHPPAYERGPGFGPCNNPGQGRPPFCDDDPHEIPLSENAAVWVLLIGGVYGIYKLKKRK